MCIRDRTKGMLKAEQQIKIRGKLHPWSPTLANAILELHLWKLIMSEIKNKTNKQTKIEQIIEKQAKYCPKEWHWQHRKSRHKIIKQNLRKAKKQLRIVQNKAKQYREDHLRQLADEAEIEENFKHAKYLRNLISIETQQSLHSIIRSHSKLTKNSGLKYIDVTRNTPKDWNTIPKRIPKDQLKRVNNIEEIEKIIIERNRQHLNQAEGTPFTQEPLLSIMGNDACTEASDKLLTGSFNYETIQTTLLQKQYLKDLRKHKGDLNSKIKSSISIDEMKKGFSKWKEVTSTSPSHRHLGHYKALLVSDGRDNDKEINNNTQRTLEIHNTLINACIYLGTPLNRWLKSIAVMIEKEKKTYKLIDYA